MLKKIVGSLAIILLFASCGPKGAESDADENSIIETSISNLLTNPLDYHGSIVKIEGMISHVCRTSGDKMRILQDGSDLTVQIMLGNFTGEFDTDSEGSRIELSGKVSTEITNIEEMEDHELDDECENTLEAIEAMRARGLDPNIRPHINLENYKIK